MEDAQDLREGKTVKVTQKIVEGKRERNVPFIGKLLKVRGIGISKTITVRQILENVAVDRIFPIMSPTISQIEIIDEKKKASKNTKRTKKSKPRK